MKLISSAFTHNTLLPSTYTCDGDGMNPPLQFEDVPSETKSLVLLMDDPDIPADIKELRGIEVFDHWVLYDIPPKTKKIDSGEPIGTIGKNSAGEHEYRPPAPPPQYHPTTHRYIFKLYALDTKLNLPAGKTKAEIEEAMHGHIIAEAELIGMYDRS